MRPLRLPKYPQRLLAEPLTLGMTNSKTKVKSLEPWDWDEWQQERALYLPSVYSSQFDELLEMNDPGQAPERGALLYTRTGKGEYVYCALALWRQLKKLHPGAVRLLANLLTPAGR